MKEVYIVSAKRTPIGGFLGNLANYTAPELGAMAIKDAYQSVGLSPEAVDSVYLGNVLSAGLGQAPARQAAIFAKIPVDKDATTVNKVCSSGLKATILGAQQIQLGIDQIVITGGMESMSRVPHYTHLREGIKLGDRLLTDGMTKDGLWDVYNDYHMGSAAEVGVSHFGMSRDELDNYALKSYQKAQKATLDNKFRSEITPLSITKGKETFTMNRDEDIDKVIPEKMARLHPAFESTGQLTAANSSNLNDGAAALILASKEAMADYQLTPLAKIIGYADAAQEPAWFTTSPAIAIEKALKQAGITLDDVDFFEINEAYASVVLSNQRLLEFPLEKVNVYGGAVAMGHPIGASGARILVTLTHVLQQEGGKYGVAAICNGGGGATAVVLENSQFEAR